jgi:putative membrane protein
MRDIRLTSVAICCAALAAVTACGTTNAVRPAAASSTIHASRTDRIWVRQAHQANLAEIQVGELAESDGGTKAVKSAGTVLARDHQALDKSLIPVAQKLTVGLPTSPSVTQTETADRLSKENGRKFDQDFAASMVTAHEIMIALTRQEIAHGSAPAVVRLARQALPVLVKHLKMMRAIVTAAG